MLLVISIGTTAPFSAICGASIRMSLVSAEDPAPMPFKASPALFAWNASLFHAASAARAFLRNPSMALFYRGAAVMTGLAAALFLQADLADRHAAVGRLDHVV